MSSIQSSKKWIIVGAGLTGLRCAQLLENQTEDSCIIVDENNEVGGVLKTEIFENDYLLDHGFQVLLPAYSRLQMLGNLEKLNLRFFEAGAIIHSAKGVTKISDPLKYPLKIFETLFSPVGTILDKLLILKILIRVRCKSDSALLFEEIGTSEDFLKNFGFSDDMIQNFWQPFFSGIFLEDRLQTQASYLQFLFKMFSLSPVAVPEKGIAILPKKMAEQLKRTEFQFQKKVTLIEKDRVHLEDGTVIMGQPIDARPIESSQWGSVTTLYFAAQKSPVDGPWLVLNSRNLNRLVNHVAVMSEVSPQYARRGDALISVNILKTNLTDSDFIRIREDLKQMFGEDAVNWRFLKSFEIPKALPLYFEHSKGEITPSQQGAFMRAEQVIKNLPQ